MCSLFQGWKSHRWWSRNKIFRGSSNRRPFSVSIKISQLSIAEPFLPSLLDFGISRHKPLTSSYVCISMHIPMYKPPINLGTGSKLPDWLTVLHAISCNCNKWPSNHRFWHVKKTGSAIIVWWCGKFISIVRKLGTRFAIDRVQKRAT